MSLPIIMGGFLSELRFAARRMQRNPAFTITVVLTLAIGIGATTAVFSVVYGVLYRPLPFPNADRVVQIVQLIPRGVGDGRAVPAREGLTPEQIVEWRATSQTLAEIGYYSPRALSLTGIETPARLNGAAVSVSLFRALGLAPASGRLFVEEDEQRGNERVVVLSHSTWESLFGRDDGVLGTSVVMGDALYRIIGVMPRDFGFPSLASPLMSGNSAGELADAPEFWIPLVAASRPAGPATGGMTLVPAFALLHPGVSIQAATAEANTLMPAREGQRFPIELINARIEQARTVRPILLLFQGAVLLVLLIACLNVINLLLAQATERRQELLVRQALGASPSQLVGSSMIEGVLLATAGGICGWMIAEATVALLRVMPPFVLPRMADVRVDSPVLAFACAISVGAGILVGVGSAFRLLRSDATSRQTTLQMSSNRGSRHHPSRIVVVVQSAAAVILLAGAATLLTSFVNLMSVDRGFQSDGLFTFRVSLPARYETGAAQLRFHDEFMAALGQMPEIQSVAASAGTLGRGSSAFNVHIDGREFEARIAYQVVTLDLFKTLGVHVSGREFLRSDTLDRAGVAIVNETFASRFLDQQGSVGRRIRFRSWPDLEIIGVAADTRMQALDSDVTPAIYLPPQLDNGGLAQPTYVLRTPRGRVQLADIRESARRLDPDAIIFDAATMDDAMARNVASQRLYMVTALTLALFAVALAAVALYGLLSYSVSQRTKEFGIRIALGAKRGTIIQNVMRELFAAVLLGVVVGILATVYLSGFLESVLFRIQPQDPLILLSVAAAFLVVAAVGCYIPARRAALVEPAVALRLE